MRKTKNVWKWESLEKQGRQGGAGGSILSQRSCDSSETLKRLLFEDLHFGSSPQCAEHLANLPKEKQITTEVKEHGGPWSRPSMFLSAVVFPRCLKADFFTITFSIKAWIHFLQDHPVSLSAEWKLHNFSDLLLSRLAHRESDREWCKLPGGRG